MVEDDAAAGALLAQGAMVLPALAACLSDASLQGSTQAGRSTLSAARKTVVALLGRQPRPAEVRLSLHVWLSLVCRAFLHLYVTCSHVGMPAAVRLSVEWACADLSLFPSSLSLLLICCPPTATCMATLRRALPPPQSTPHR